MLPSSPRQTLTIVYNPWKKLLALLGLVFILWLARTGLRSNFFIFEITLVLLTAYACKNIADIVVTQSISFYPDRIVKTGYFGPTTMPTDALVITEHDKEPITRFFHRSDKNSRESILVYEWFLSPEIRLWLENYRRNVYRTDNRPRLDINARVPEIEFNKALSTFRSLALMTLVYLLCCVLYATYLHWRYPVFIGYAPDLPAAPVRLLFIAAALGAYRVLSRMAVSSPTIPSNQAIKIQHGRKRTLCPALTANGVAWLGLPLFLLTGNKLDFYLMLLIGIGFYYDFYPRLSDWERLLQTDAQLAAVSLPRRSLQVSLVLLGGLSLASYAGDPADFRIRQHDCQDQNGNPSECQSGSGGSFGSSHGSSSNNHSPVRRGGFGSSGGSHFSFGG